MLQKDYDLVEYKHDVERFISDLAKLAGIRNNERNDAGFLYNRLIAINGIALALSAKTSFLSYLEISNSADDLEIETVRHKVAPSIERVSYVARHLTFLHHGRNVRNPINLSLNSHSFFKGPSFFEFIPYALIDNAVKYNTRDGDIEIEVFDENGRTLVDIESLGPVIEVEEEEQLFKKGYRGIHAKDTGLKGAGIGLFHASEAMRHAFGGEVCLVESQRERAFTVSGVPYCRNRFRISIPTE